MSFFIFIRETQISCVNYEFSYTQDQLKGLATFIRSHNDISSIDMENDIGISSTFFNNQITIEKLPNPNYVPFDATYLIYSKFIKIKKTDEKNIISTTFIEMPFLILINGVKISSYDVLYYSQFLICNKKLCPPLTCNYFPNTHAIVDNYLI